MKDKNKKSAKKLQKEEEAMKKKRKKRKRSKNKEYTIISYFFVAIFISLIGYMVYFNVEKRETDRLSHIQKLTERVMKQEFILTEISLPMW